MKSLKIVMCLLLCCALVFPCLGYEAAAEVERKSAEIVILIDVSGSMAQDSDPLTMPVGGTRRTIEAAELFGMNAPDDTDMFIKVIPYCEDVCTTLDKVNVSEDFATYQKNLNDILIDKNNYDNKTSPDTIPGISCWDLSSFTDIGLALENSVKAFEGSTADKKAVILFTDGKIKLQAGPEADKISEGKAYTSAAALSEANIALFSIGLDHDGKGNVDKAFLAKLHGVPTIDDTKNVTIIEKASDILGAFTNIFSYLNDGYKADEKLETFDVTPEVETQRTIRIYENAVEKASIDLSSSAPLHTVRVENPNGVVVANINLDAPQNNKIDSNFCSFGSTTMKHSVKLELVNYPAGGDWKVYVKGEKGTVVESKLYLVALTVRDSLTDGDTHYIGDEFSYKASLHSNVDGQQLQSPELFSAELRAEGTVTIIPVSGGSAYSNKTVLDESGVVYNCTGEFKMPGEYTVTTTLSHEQYSETSQKKITVVGPKLVISAPTDYTGIGPVDLTIKAVHPKTGEALTKLPDYLSGTKAVVNAVDAKGQKHTYNLDTEKILSGVVQTCAPTTVGETGFTVEMVSSDAVETVLLASEALKIDFKSNTFDVKIPSSVGTSALSGAYEEKINLAEAFKAYEGKVNFAVKTEGDAVISAVIEGDNLIIKTSDFGKGKVILTANDSIGSTQDFVINVNVESMMGLLIAIICIVVGLIVVAVVAILVINRKKIISIAFKVKVEKVDPDTYNSTEIVYSIPRLVTRKNAKPTMSLGYILTANGFSSVISGNMNEADIQNFKSTYASSFELTGIPFKKEFKAVLKSADKKVVSTVRFNNKSTVSIKTKDGVYTVSFGNMNAFVEQFSW